MEYDLVNHPHPHPLLFDEEGKFNEVCSRCRLLLFNMPGFKCSDSDCNFYIHQSCIHLPPQIHNPFHPQHPLLKEATKSILNLCKSCGQKPSLDEVYGSSSTDYIFQMDIKCAIADTKSSGLLQMGNEKYQHFSHPHPLTLFSPTLQQQEDSTEGIIKKLAVCVICLVLIESGSSTYFCSQCDNVHYHKQCAELPRKLQNPDIHRHHLFLLPIVDVYNSMEFICNSCRNCCIGFVYSCPLCNFFLHVTCLQSNHKHTLTMLRVDIPAFTCGICGGGKDREDRAPWFCNICHILVHKRCVEFPLTLWSTEHNHDLTFDYFLSDVDRIIFCKICGREINTKYATYGCSECNYFTHLDCAYAQGQCVDPHATDLTLHADSTENDDKDDEKNYKKIPHFCHPDHNLTLFPHDKSRELEYRVCDGCMVCLSASGTSYGCSHQYCEFFVHEECTKLPTTKSHPRFHPHLLTLISIPNFVFQCEACLQHFQGFAYHCKICLSTFDVRCASIQIPFKHPNHQHPLYLSDFFLNSICKACGKWMDNRRLAFRCTETNCEFCLDLRCATLPVIVRYRFDPHPLNLTFVEEERIDDYYCDICEEERELGVWFYSCRECSFAAHPRCAIGEFPYVKSMIHKSHKHPLSLVMKTCKKNEGETEGGVEDEAKGKGKVDEGGGYCGACKESCARNLAFECGICKFNVHATGRCYNLEVMQGNLAFTNHNVFSRANQPYDYDKLIQNLPITKILGPFGKLTYTRWTESVFSTIRAFVIYHNEHSINCIQIQYGKNGELVWSEKHGKEEDTKSEVSFEYPEEYLISMHGSYRKSDNLICSLTLQTNRKTYGPFGVEVEDKFSSVKEGVEIVGIFGSSNYFEIIDSIGFFGISTQE